MQISLEELKRHKIYIAKAIQSRADGELYVPIFERLEREIEKRREGLDTWSRIRTAAETH